MKRLLSLLALTCTVAACSQSRAPADTAVAPNPPKPAASANAGSDDTTPAAPSTRLTVYSDGYDALAQRSRASAADMPGYALVHSTLHFMLNAGANFITVDRLPRAIDVGAVALRPVGDGATVLGQRYLAAPAGADAVLAAALGQRIAVEHTSGGSKQTDNGILVAAGDGLTLALPDGRTKVIREYDNFSLLDPERQPPARPTLRWQVRAHDAGDTAFALSYPTGGLAWRAEYRATVKPGNGCTLALDGAALVANRSGVDYRNVALTLVAGEPNRVREGGSIMFDRAASAGYAAPAPAPPMPQPRKAGEYYAYPIPARTTLADASIERVPLFARLPAVKCERAYRTEPATNVWQPPQPLIAPGYNDDTGPQPVKATVAFANDKAAGLGRPLPGGRVRVFEGDDLLGESTLAHTPEGSDIDLEVGTAFDLRAERERNSFDVNRSGRSMTESFAITLHNAGKADATVTVVEPLSRWSDWQVIASSLPATRRDAQHAQFEVPVPAAGDSVLTYTVRYRWPEGVRP